MPAPSVIAGAVGTTFNGDTSKNLTTTMTTSGSNKKGLAFAGGDFLGSVGSSNTATWAGSAMTYLGAVLVSGQLIMVWWIDAPAAGSSTVAISSLTGALYGWGGCFCVQDGGTPTGFATATGTSSPSTVNITSATGDLVLGFVAEHGIDPTVGAGQTEIVEGALFSFRYSAASYEAGASSVTMSWTHASSTEWSIAGVNIPAVGSNRGVLIDGKLAGQRGGVLQRGLVMRESLSRESRRIGLPVPAYANQALRIAA